MKKQMPESNPKFQQIIDASQHLFWRFGIKRVTIEEVCRTALVSKMTFYKYFANKNDLVKFIIHLLFAEGMAKYNDIMNLSVEYPEKVRQIIFMKLQLVEGMSFEFIREYFQGADPEIKKLIEQKTAEMIGTVVSRFPKSASTGICACRFETRVHFIFPE